MIETFLSLLFLQFFPFVYTWFHDVINKNLKLPLVELFEILSIPILVFPIILTSLGIPKVAKTSSHGPILEPTKFGYIVSILFWILIDFILAVSITQVF